MSVYQNHNATCPQCFWQESALQGDVTSKNQCKKCKNNNNRPGWEPKPGVIFNTCQGVDSKGKVIFIRRVAE